MKKAYVQIMTAAALWGVMGVFVRGLTALGFSQVQIGLLRVSVAALMMLFVLIKKDKQLFCVRLKDLWCFVGTGVVSLTIYNICYFTALQHVTMSVAAVLVYTAPAFVMIMSAFIFGEKITIFRLEALALVFGGCVMVTGLVGGSAVSASPLGIMYGLGAGVSYALYSIFGRFALNRGYHTYTVTFYTFLFSTLGSIPLAQADELIVRMTMTPMSFLYAGGLGIISCALPYLLYTKGLLSTDNSTASMLATLEPAVATLTGVLFFREILTWYNIVGMLMLFAGITLLSYFSKPIQRSEENA